MREKKKKKKKAGLRFELSDILKQIAFELASQGKKKRITLLTLDR